MKTAFLALAIALAIATLATFASATDYSATLGNEYLLVTGDSLVLGDWSVKVVDMAPPQAIAVRVYEKGSERLGFSRLQQGVVLDLSFASIELVNFTADNLRARVLLTAPGGQSNQTGNASPQGTPGGTGAGGQGLDALNSSAAAAAPVSETANETSRGYPEAKAPVEDASNSSCKGLYVPEAMAIVTQNDVEPGTRVAVLIEDSIDLAPLANRQVKVTYPSLEAYLITTNAQGGASFNAIERGAYEISSYECYNMPPVRVFARNPELPAIVFYALPRGVAEYLSNHFEQTLLLAVLAALALGLAWLAFSTMRENTDFDDAAGDALLRVRDGARRLKERLLGGERGQVAIGHLVLLAGVIFLAAAALYIFAHNTVVP